MKNEENSKTQTAVLGGGCFWCLEAVFSQLKGVTKVESGYSGGNKPNPAEVIKIEFDPDKISYEILLRIFLQCMILQPLTAREMTEVLNTGQ